MLADLARTLTKLLSKSLAEPKVHPPTDPEKGDIEFQIEKASNQTGNCDLEAAMKCRLDGRYQTSLTLPFVIDGVLSSFLFLEICSD
jgi:hypothetical protein